MKKRLAHIFFLLAAFMVFSSRSCVPETADNRASDQAARHDSLIREFREHFGADYLMDEQLMLFSDKAKQKLLDFVDLLNLYIDPKVDTAFRNQVRIALLKVFLENEARISLWPAGKGAYAVPAQMWINKVDKHPYTTIRYSVGKLIVVEPLRAFGPDLYKGSISATFQVTGFSGNDTVYSEESERQVGMVVTRISKPFGIDTYEDVWQVFLNGLE